MPPLVLDVWSGPFHPYRGFSLQEILSISDASHLWIAWSQIRGCGTICLWYPAVPLRLPDQDWRSDACVQSESYGIGTSAPDMTLAPGKGRACRHIRCRISWIRWRATNRCLQGSRQLSRPARTYATALCSGMHPLSTQARNVSPPVGRIHVYNDIPILGYHVHMTHVFKPFPYSSDT